MDVPQQLNRMETDDLPTLGQAGAKARELVPLLQQGGIESLAEAARRLGVSRQRVHQLKKKYELRSQPLQHEPAPAALKHCRNCNEGFVPDLAHPRTLLCPSCWTAKYSLTCPSCGRSRQVKTLDGTRRTTLCRDCWRSIRSDTEKARYGARPSFGGASGRIGCPHDARLSTVGEIGTLVLRSLIDSHVSKSCPHCGKHPGDARLSFARRQHAASFPNPGDGRDRYWL